MAKKKKGGGKKTHHRRKKMSGSGTDDLMHLVIGMATGFAGYWGANKLDKTANPKTPFNVPTEYGGPGEIVVGAAAMMFSPNAYVKSAGFGLAIAGTIVAAEAFGALNGVGKAKQSRVLTLADGRKVMVSGFYDLQTVAGVERSFPHAAMVGSMYDTPIAEVYAGADMGNHSLSGTHN